MTVEHLSPRLAKSAREPGAPGYQYDQYGNRWNQTVTSGSGIPMSAAYDANNHVTPTNCSNNNYYCYDVAGNTMANSRGGAWNYDAEGKILSFANSAHTGSYVYDALGERVERILDGTPEVYASDEMYANDLQPYVMDIGKEISRSKYQVAVYFKPTLNYDGAARE